MYHPRSGPGGALVMLFVSLSCSPARLQGPLLRQPISYLPNHRGAAMPGRCTDKKPQGQWRLAAQSGPQPTIAVQTTVPCTSQLRCGLGARLAVAPQLLWDYGAGMPRQDTSAQLRLHDTFVRYETLATNLQVGHLQADATGARRWPSLSDWHRVPSAPRRRRRTLGRLWSHGRDPPAELWGLRFERRHVGGALWQTSTGLVVGTGYLPESSRQLAYRGDFWQPVRGCRHRRDCAAGYFCGAAGVCVSQQVVLEAPNRVSRMSRVGMPARIGTQMMGLYGTARRSTPPDWDGGAMLLVLRTWLPDLGPGRAVLMREPAAVRYDGGHVLARVWLTWGGPNKVHRPTSDTPTAHSGGVEANINGCGLWALTGYGHGPVQAHGNYCSRLTLQADGWCNPLSSPACAKRRPWHVLGPGVLQWGLGHNAGPVSVQGSMRLERRRGGGIAAGGALKMRQLLRTGGALAWYGSMSVPVHGRSPVVRSRAQPHKRGIMGLQATLWPSTSLSAFFRLTATRQKLGGAHLRPTLGIQGHDARWGVRAALAIALHTSPTRPTGGADRCPACLRVATWVVAGGVRCTLGGTAGPRRGGFGTDILPDIRGLALQMHVSCATLL